MTDAGNRMPKLVPPAEAPDMACASDALRECIVDAREAVNRWQHEENLLEAGAKKARDNVNNLETRIASYEAALKKLT